MSDVVYPEPTWGTPQLAVEPASSLCASGITPFILTGILVRLLQYHFSDPNNIVRESLQYLRWYRDCTDGIVDDDGNSLRRLYINVGYQLDLANAEQRPGIFVKREDVRTRRISVEKGDSVTTHIKQRIGAFQGKIYHKILEGAFSLICIAESGAEADLLGEEVFDRMLFFAPMIEDDIRIGQFEVKMLSDVKELEAGANKAYYTVVRIQWASQRRWTIVAETPVLKRIRFIYPIFDE
jgi:hypothetical protein